MWGIYSPVSLTSVPGQVMEQLIMETFSRHLKDKKVIWNSQHGIMKRQSYLTNMIALYNDLTGLVFEGSRVDLRFYRSLVRFLITSFITSSQTN